MPIHTTLESVCASAFDDVDEGTRVEDDLGESNGQNVSS